ncbi:MAG TPA: flagellar hook-associated protein FlgL [Fimbriimonas sp.]|nr:flagellar hook-associated protein FlgL [Fimbriimonas sp.]
MNRVSTGYQFQKLQSQVHRAGLTYFEAQKRVSTGKRINDISDDPNGFSQVVSMRSVKSGLAQYSTNLDRAKTWFTLSESAMNETSTLLNRANALAISGANATVGQGERTAMAVEVTSIRDRLVQLSNTRNANGDYLFAGTATDTKPFTVSGNTIVYAGNNGQVKVEAAPGELMTLSQSSVPTLFQETYDKLTGMINALNSNDGSYLSNTTLTEVQESIQQFNQARGELGTKVRTLELYKNDHARRIEELTSNVSDIEDVDLAQAITDYQSAQTAYQAALQMTSQGSRLSLMDFIQG